ncbi:murein biosynthesis integral membrane protein MurJ [Desulfoferrobacter suflitae]|uniref:murein biosynthesis integral membrane protein MurJ n=1 Tax=Desulfoferrobacter suflitae TaxID=2865782 RepID=UPI00216447B8|nr:murein biosynthesis integral membrane protein MurJ [Desulfoferrobacter suflitae]MCK8603121.1 murein biosynthesis integral membrane protein MurJ [Desulfoferrobacter suflitae]
MGWAAFIMGASILVSRFMGLIRDKTISYFFGASNQSDLYFAAFVIPDFINYLLAGAYFSITLIPLLADYFDHNEQDGWHFFSTVFTWIGLIISVLTGVAMILAPQLAHIAAPGLQEEDLTRLAWFLRIILPAQICFLLGSCLSAVLYLRKQFTVPALTPLIYNLSIIAGGVLLHGWGIVGFCWGVLAGALLGNLLLPYLAVRWGGGLRLRFSLYHPGLKRFIVLALPLMLGQSIVVLDEQLVRVFGSLAGVGAISWLSYARRIMLVPVGVVAQAAGVASFPFLADLFSKKNFTQFHKTLNEALKSVLTLLIPVSLWMMVVARPTITLIFQQGHFGWQDTEQTALLLQILLAAVFCWGFQQVLGRGFYACQDTLTPAILGTIVMLISLPVYYVLTQHYQAVGVALASAISVALYTAALFLWWLYRFGGESFAGLGEIVVKVAIVSVVACGPATFLATLRIPHWHNHPYLEALYTIAASGLMFSIIFLALAGYFLPALIRPFLRKLGPLGTRFIR